MTNYPNFKKRKSLDLDSIWDFKFLEDVDYDKFNVVDGFFLDGRMYSSCNNALHGCGVKNFEGKLVPERNVWDGRKKQLRMYKLIKQRNGYCEQHKSGNWDAPTCFLWDCV